MPHQHFQAFAIITVTLFGTLTDSSFGNPEKPEGVREDKPASARIIREGNVWRLDTDRVSKLIVLEHGRLLCKSITSEGGELVSADNPSEEFFLSTGEPAQPITAASGDWELMKEKQTPHDDGSRQLDLSLRRGPLQVTKAYVLYPGSSIIREWITVTNTGDKPLRVIDPGFLSIRVRPGEPSDTDFMWMTGGENQPGSWMLKTERLAPDKPRDFNSYEPFPGVAARPPGDGVRARILLNDRPLWPAGNWQLLVDSSATAEFDVTTEVAAGDRIAFAVNMNGDIGYDTTRFNPTIAYESGETHTASQGFSNEQGRNGWRYQYLDKGGPVDLVWYPQFHQWRKALDNATGTPFISVDSQHPDVGQDAIRVWTAPRPGRLRLTGTVCNTGNPTQSRYGFRMGTSSYAPWAALYNQQTRNGVFVGWDYFGHWASSYALQPDGSVTARLRVAGHKQTLAPGESLITPKAFVGLYKDDLDNAGNELLDWQYRYLWDYTREEWFPAIRMLGYWYKGTCWNTPQCGWIGGKPDWESTFLKVFRVADLMRYVGADVYHRDWGWWDRAGDWNGPDFRTTGEYLRKNGMGQLIYAFLYTVDLQSRVAREHPDWLLGNALDMSRPEVVKFMLGQLDDFYNRWGRFEWRNDSTPTAPNQGDDTCLLGQDAGLRDVIRGFLDRHPDCAFQAVNGGGNNAGCDYARYASTVSFSDGAVGTIRNYYASLFLPPDKTSDIPDIWDPNKFDKASWRGLLCINFDMTGDTWDTPKLEGIRELIDIYHYLQTQGVVGRWVHVYRPLIEGDDPTMYFQRLSRDGLRGIIIPKRPTSGAVTIKPKGLQTEETFVVSFHESENTETRTGRSLMEQGIRLNTVAPGELIYLNLPLHPGSKRDTMPPVAPKNVTVRRGRNMGFPGVELSWTAASDDNWVSYYEILRDDVIIDKVAKGTFYFDHSAGADPAGRYAVRTLDGAGNASPVACAAGSTVKRAVIFDDADAGVVCTGPWQRQTGLQPAHAGTVSVADQKDASAEIVLEGKRVLWFSKLGANCGMAFVSIDGGPPETVDTFSADDIWGARVYEKEFAKPGRHTIRIQVTGTHNPRSAGDQIFLDGFRAEPQ